MAAAWLPPDIIDAIADAVVADAHDDAPCASMLRLGVAPALAADAQAALRVLAGVSRAWRRALLPRAWASVVLAGVPRPTAHDIHALAAPCVRRLVVPWGAMAAPVPWSVTSDTGSASDTTSASDTGSVDLADSDSATDSATDSDTGSICVVRSADSHRRLFLGAPAKAAAAEAGPRHRAECHCRIRAVFGASVWPAVEHLDMSFMPLICYQGLAAHIQRTMPRLRTLRVGGFVPATALADMLLAARLPLEAVEISASVWANADGPRRGSASS
ncbi:hypothetical protein LPJ61_006244, partial [Coemansia biformis]